MNRTRSTGKFRIGKTAAIVAVATMTTTAMPGFYSPALADKGAAFLGGVLAGGLAKGMVDRSRIRTAAEVHHAYGQPSRAAVAVPAQAAPAPAPAAAPLTPQQKLDQLDKLAAGGYITPEEYKAKKKAILDSM